MVIRRTCHCFLNPSQGALSVSLGNSILERNLTGQSWTVGFTGNVIWSKDPNGNVSEISYTDNFGSGSNPDSGSGGTNGATFALPTLVTNALGHQARTQYDYTLGSVGGVKDVNGLIGKTEYDSIFKEQ